MGWGGGEGGNLTAEGPLDKNKGRCFLNGGQVGEKMRVSEREDRKTRRVETNEGPMGRVNDSGEARGRKGDGETCTCREAGPVTLGGAE